jgi:hypothetical protein
VNKYSHYTNFYRACQSNDAPEKWERNLIKNGGAQKRRLGTGLISKTLKFLVSPLCCHQPLVFSHLKGQPGLQTWNGPLAGSVRLS